MMTPILQIIASIAGVAAAIWLRSFVMDAMQRMEDERQKIADEDARKKAEEEIRRRQAEHDNLNKIGQ